MDCKKIQNINDPGLAAPGALSRRIYQKDMYHMFNLYLKPRTNNEAYEH
jgi:hypothetical protein